MGLIYLLTYILQIGKEMKKINGRLRPTQIWFLFFFYTNSMHIDGYMHIHWVIFYGGRSKKTTFGYVKDMVRRKINSLRGRALSIQLACLKSDGEGFQWRTFNMAMIVNL
jgi:hypothetical protein